MQVVRPDRCNWSGQEFRGGWVVVMSDVRLMNFYRCHRVLRLRNVVFE